MHQSIRVLAMSLPDLRQEIVKEIAFNPVIEDVDHVLEKPMDEAISQNDERQDDSRTDFPEDEAIPSVNPNEDALERRQRFFDNQVNTETLQDHLERQIAVSDLPPQDYPLARTLIGNLNDDGYFVGSIPDIIMVSGENESHILKVLSVIGKFDPLGCGARNLKECLLLQMDKLDDSPWEDEVRKLVEKHLEDIAEGRVSKILQSLSVSRTDYAKALRELRTLDPKPGRAFVGSSESNRIVKPEVHAVSRDGRWVAEVDDRSLPEIKISSKYIRMIEDSSTSKETREYLQERLAAASRLAEAIEHREETIRAVAQAIFDRQPGFFEFGLKGLKPLTMVEIAEEVGVHPSTVSRTVTDKYVSTPKGVLELRKFFLQGVETSSGEVVAKDAVREALKSLVASEDKACPYSDEALAEKLKEQGFPVARRTVAKYRVQLGIPGTPERRKR
ncbi:MAG: RNA polymerase factor sigma-54 [Kiritimatiellae bacterium]|nr:RNA polymerase factor sigma-54 [Kiritimatiellia bacterium]